MKNKRTPDVERTRMKPELSPREALALFFRAGLNSNGTKRERRLYKRLWNRVKRAEDPSFRAREAARMRGRRLDPDVKKADAARHAKWALLNRKKVGRYNARWHREHRQRRCFSCRRPARPGRYGLRQITRAIEEGNRLVERVVLHCGC
jgi:hypothetical protein